MITGTIQRRLRGIYRDTAGHYRSIAEREPRLSYNYKILYNPPLMRPEIMFIGYQPGGTASVEGESERELEGWPRECEYAHASYKLAVKALEMFPDVRRERCIALNSIFTRYPNARDFRSVCGRDLYCEIWNFCRPRMESIVRMLDPKFIVLIGFETAKLWGGPLEVDCYSDKGRPLTLSATIAGRRAIGVLHISGCRISSLDRELISKRIVVLRHSY